MSMKIPAAALLLAVLAGPRAFAGYRVGVALPLSGPEGAVGRELRDALDLQADDINRAGGVAGKRLELVIRDDADDPERAARVAEEFAADPAILAVIGHYDNRPIARTLPIYDRAKLPVIFPTLSNPELVKATPWVFSATYSDARAAETLAAYLCAVRRARSVFVLHSEDDYGMFLAKEFAGKAGRLGMNVRSVSYPAQVVGLNNPLPEDFVARHWSGPADAVVIFGHALRAEELLCQLRARGIRTPVYGSDRTAEGLLHDQGAGPVYVASPFLFEFSSLGGVRFQRRFHKHFRSLPSVTAAFAYDALGLTAQALAKAGPSRQALRDALAAFDSAAHSYEGATGRLYFDKDGSMVRDTVMGEVRNRQIRPWFTQLRLVTDARDLEALPRKVQSGEIMVVDKTPFYKVQVVYVGIDHYRIDQVSVRDLTFDSEFFLWFKWTGDLDVEKMRFLNGILGKDNRVKVLDNLAEAKGPEAVKWASFKVKGTYVNPYDLRLFPFDTQTLPVRVAHRTLDANHLMLVADRGYLSQRPVREIFPQEWRYAWREDFAGTFNYESSFGNPDHDVRDSDFSVYESDLVIHRILFPYLLTLFFPLGLLLTVSLLVLIIPMEQFAPRNSLVMSTLLGVLVYHMTQARSLPQVGYLVRSDLYFVTAYVILFFMVLGVNLVNLLLSKKKEALAGQLDRSLRWGFVAAIVLSYGLLTASAFWRRS